MINPAPVPKAKPTYEVKLQAVKAKLSKWTNAKMKEEYENLFQKNFDLLEEIKTLKEKINS